MSRAARNMMDLSQKQARFAQEYPKLFDAIYQYLRYRILDADEAEDLVSQVFIKAYTQLDKYDEEIGSLKQWLFGISKNELLMHYRSQKLRVSLDEIAEVIADPSHEDAEGRIDRKMMTDRIYARLNPEQKALFALRYQDGLSFEELAECTGRESSALRQMFSRLHRVLRLEFEELVIGG